MITPALLDYLTTELRRTLGVNHPAVDAVVEMCSKLAFLPFAEQEIKPVVDDDQQAMDAFDKHIKYAIKAARRMQGVDNINEVIEALVDAHILARLNLPKPRAIGGRPRKLGMFHFALAISGALARNGVPRRAQAAIIRQCFHLLKLSTSEAESAIKAVAAWNRNNPLSNRAG